MRPHVWVTEKTDQAGGNTSAVVSSGNIGGILDPMRPPETIGAVAVMSSVYPFNIYVIGVTQRSVGESRAELVFRTTRGDLTATLMMTKGMRRGVVLLGDAGGSPDGPDSLLSELADELFGRGIASVRLAYRNPGNCVECVIDSLLAVQHLDDESVRDVAMIGWAYGGAVAIAAGSIAGNVLGVAALSTSDVGDRCLRRMWTKPLLLIQGGRGDKSPVSLACGIREHAGDLCSIITYPDAGHTLAEVHTQVVADVSLWLSHILTSDRVAA